MASRARDDRVALRAAASGVKRVGLFGASTLLNAVTALVTIPIVVNLGGVGVWADASVGMAIGAICATLISLGWPITGVAATAGRDARSQGVYLASSVASRALLTVPGILLASIAAMMIAPGSAAVCVLSSIAVTLQGLSSNWYFVGTSDPLGIFLCDAVVRASALAVAAAALVLLKDPILFFVLQLTGAVVSIILAWWRIRRRTSVSAISMVGLKTGLAYSRGQAHGSLTSVVAALYQSLPLLVVSSIAPGSTSVYAIADRLLKLSNTAGQPFIQAIQGWIPAGGQRLYDRIRRGCSLALALGVVGGTLLVSFGPLLSSLLTQGKIQASLSLMLPIGITLAATLLSQCVGVASLVPLGGVKIVARSAVLGAACAVLGLLLLVPSFGAVAAAWCVASSELIVLVYQSIALTRRLRERRAREEESK